MRNIPIPSREEDFTADPAELFFDLSFVFAFSRLVFHLVHDPTLKGFGEFVLLFTLKTQKKISMKKKNCLILSRIFLNGHMIN